MVVVEEKERRRVNAAGLQLILPEMFQRRVAGPWSCEWAGYPTLKHFGQYHLQPATFTRLLSFSSATAIVVGSPPLLPFTK